MRLRKKSLPVVSIEAVPNPDDESAPPMSLELGASDLVLEGVIDRINLERCIQQLPAGFRKIFVLHDIQGYRHREIANLLGRSVGDSKSQLHKARKRLRESLRELQRNKTRDERLMAANCLPDPPPGKRSFLTIGRTNHQSIRLSNRPLLSISGTMLGSHAGRESSCLKPLAFLNPLCT
jgi:hypothetical protein